VGVNFLGIADMSNGKLKNIALKDAMGIA